MGVRITWQRVAMAALFVLAGVGLGNLLSPLVGTALATVGTVSNISDHSSSGYFAKVDSTGKLAVGDGSGPMTVDGAVRVNDGAGPLTVDGNVAIAAPRTPFSFPATSFEDNGANPQFGATNATIAFTGFRIANGTPGFTLVSTYQYPETSTDCSVTSGGRFLGEFAVPALDTVDEQLTTPLVVKPLSGSPYWCFITFASGTSGSGFYITYSGYVVSGSFTPPNPGLPPPGKALLSRGDAK